MNFDGVLFFPVTAFTKAGEVDASLTAEHITSRLEFSPGAVFAACGTGEFHALNSTEVTTVVRAAVSAVNGAVPVIAGTGGPLGHAIECARGAADAGADALLVLPPYLVGHPVDGTLAYVGAVIAASDLPVIVYHRGSATLTRDAVQRLVDNERVIGLKDGVGDVGLAHEIARIVKHSGRADLSLFNGLLTAELTQEAYRAIGVPLYSSAAFAMIPQVAAAFYGAYVGHDDDRCAQLIDEFYTPLVRLRDAVPGYAVSLVKAGVRLGGLPVGPVRAPLVDPTPEHAAELQRVLDVGRNLVSA
ncbi:5-dehydro-4-deoxyglucarate dehydratase [Paramicrobacterium chengjingii]|uniref:5-dehydro-4-deoxyglucarate dehydratase n=1 Tax=Paramicrobacterium chengjingii TaxID=2769067 RepID=UPI00142006A5|nr:5-dehydro-4-deoxyglucarate dehydratase [Microbacterium chengjingii]